MNKPKMGVALLVTIVVTFALAFSTSEAQPTNKTTDSSSDYTVEGPERLTNNSRLVITNVVKTIEFEVGILEDDGDLDENATTVNGTDFYETDVQLLNLDLLKEVVSKADAERQNETKKSSEN